MVHDWWQVGDEEAGVVVEVDPGDRFVEMVGTFFGLARDGKVDGKGVPHLLQLALSARDYRDTMIPAEAAARAVQRSSSASSVRSAGRCGRKPTYPEYLVSEVVVEPDPDALALVGEDGRLRLPAPLRPG